MSFVPQSSKVRNGIRSISILQYRFTSMKSEARVCPTIFSLAKRILLFITNLLLKRDKRWASWLVRDCKNDVYNGHIVWIKDDHGRKHIIPLKTVVIRSETVTHEDTTTDKDTTYERNTKRYRSKKYQFNGNECWKIFEFREDRFVWVEELGMFDIPVMNPLDILNEPTTRNYVGLNQTEHRRRLITYGPNIISAKRNKKWKRFLRELRRPILVLPIACLLMWCFKSDWLVTIISIIIVLYSFSVSIKDFTPSNRVVKMLAKAYGNEIRVIRGGESFITGSSSLVPGDLIEINGRMTLPCDAILLKGTVECDEQQITGDPTPTVKYPATSKIREIVQNNLLIGGTKVRKVKAPTGSSVIAVVEKTGFQTMRGRLMKQILAARRMALSHKYMSDTHFMLKLMLVCGVCTFIIISLYAIGTFNLLITKGYYYYNIFDALIICPPFLAIIYTVPLLTLKKQLKKKGFNIQNLYSILSFGNIDIVCFDKTNTLTLPNYELEGVIEVRKGVFTLPIRTTEEFSFSTLGVMGACNSLSVVDGKVQGDPMEKELFDQSGFSFVKSADSNDLTVVRSNPYLILKIAQVIPFHSKDRKNGALVFTPVPTYFIKGSPSTIASLCNPSTIPSDFDDVVRKYGMLGYRILAFASKKLSEVAIGKDAGGIHLHSLEKNLDFNGFFLFQNTLVPDCGKELIQLRKADIDICMITGDNIYTSTAVAQKCNLLNKESSVRYGSTKDLSSFETIVSWDALNNDTLFQTTDDNVAIAMSGDSLSILRKGKDSSRKRYLYNKLIKRCKIFSDILPMQKGELVQDFRDQDLNVCFVGDGSNDVFGISRANIGLSITNDLEANTSSFAAPVACDQEIGIPVAYLIRQSRCLMENMVRAAKFTFIYFFIQMLIILENNFSTYFANTRTAWQLIQGFILTVYLAKNKPLKKLRKSKPPTRILTLGFFFSVLIHVILHASVFAISLGFLRSTQFYAFTKTLKITGFRYFSWWENRIPPYQELESHLTFIISNFQLLASAVSIHFTSVHSHPLKNVGFFVAFTLFFVLNLWIAFPFPYAESGPFSFISFIHKPIARLFYIITSFESKNRYEPQFFMFRCATIPIFVLQATILLLHEFIHRSCRIPRRKNRY